MLLQGAAAALALWFALVGLTFQATRPRIGRQASLEPVPELSPAVLALLMSPNGRLTVRAASATLLDLATRGLVAMEVDPSGHRWVHLPEVPRQGLRSYEQQVYDHVEARCRAGGRVPEQVLHLDSQERAETWLDRFAEQVVDDARAAGLVRRRAPMARVALSLALLAPVALALAGAAQDGPPGTAWLVGLWLVFGYGICSVGLRRLTRWVPNEFGRRVAAGYCPTVDELKASAPVELGPPVSRRSAYAVALGLPTRPARYAPLAAGTGSVVWSRRTGAWRQMRVRGPGGVMTGADPKTALWTLPGAIPFFAIWCFLLINASSQWVPAWVRLLAPLGWAVWGGGGFFLGRFIYRGLYDLSHPPEQVVGQVVQLEYISGNDDSPAKYIVALDEGGGQDAVTYEVSSSTYGRLTAGSWLRLDVTPKLRHVHREEIIIRE